ncbi:MAG: response regulator [Candidatus Riflebacteria bacterium]|nr:response regulator [Candidatus Riflebacteria bacterium]
MLKAVLYEQNFYLLSALLVILGAILGNFLGHIFEFFGCVLVLKLGWENYTLKRKNNQSELPLKIIDQIQDIIWVQKTDLTPIFFNKAANEFFKQSTTETKEKKCFEIFGRNQPCEDCLKVVALESRKVEYREVFLDDKKVWFEICVVPIFNEDNEISKIIEIFHNITRYKQEEGIRRETHEAIMRKAVSAAESASKTKSLFLANMSHEIRTPMNGVIGMTGLLLETKLTKEQREFTEMIRSSGEHLLTLVNDILDFSKIEAGKLDLEIIDFALRSTIEDCVHLLSLKAKNKNIDLLWIMEPNVPVFLRGDPGRLRQILMNLTENAIKFTPWGEISIRIFVVLEEVKNVRLRFEVQDSGIGISQEKIFELFKPFSQGDASTTKKYGGTGLGLSISKRLAELMIGEIGVNSTVGVGSTFWFTAVFEKQSKAREASLFNPEILANQRILIVDDNATNRRLLEKLLESWHFRQEQAVNGLDAINLLQQAAAAKDPFRIALLDYQMPEMDGEELGVRIKQDPAISATLLIVLSSGGIRGDAKRFTEIGFSAYLTKPFRQTVLYDCLVTVLSNQKYSEKDEEKKLVTVYSITEEKRQRYKILLAEDNLTNKKVAMAIMEKLGYKADAVLNGKEAVKCLEATSYDLVLMDCQMPEMDGYQATKEIRSENSNVKNRKVPIIAMTANAMEGDREKCLSTGMDDYLSKPIHPRDLSAMLKKWLQ